MRTASGRAVGRDRWMIALDEADSPTADAEHAPPGGGQGADGDDADDGAGGAQDIGTIFL